MFVVPKVDEGFRRSSRWIVTERNAKLKERELLFRELRHQVNNDFTRHAYTLPERESVDLQRYLDDLCEALPDAVLPPAGIKLTSECAVPVSCGNMLFRWGLSSTSLSPMRSSMPSRMAATGK